MLRIGSICAFRHVPQLTSRRGLWGRAAPPPVIGAIYQHYKGNLYKILNIAHDAGSLKKCVVYEGQYTCKEFGKNPVWIRELTEFMESITHEGKTMPRFKLTNQQHE